MYTYIDNDHYNNDNIDNEIDVGDSNYHNHHVYVILYVMTVIILVVRLFLSFSCHSFGLYLVCLWALSNTLGLSSILGVRLVLLGSVLFLVWCVPGQ